MGSQSPSSVTGLPIKSIMSLLLCLLTAEEVYCEAYSALVDIATFAHMRQMVQLAHGTCSRNTTMSMTLRYLLVRL